VDDEELAELLEPAVRPSLRAVAAAYRPLLDGWERGYCPVCGAGAERIDEVASNGIGRLGCPRCAAEWASPEAPGRSFRLELGEHEPDETMEDLLELD
jgi:hypothetical protein